MSPITSPQFPDYCFRLCQLPHHHRLGRREIRSQHHRLPAGQFPPTRARRQSHGLHRLPHRRQLQSHDAAQRLRQLRLPPHHLAANQQSHALHGRRPFCRCQLLHLPQHHCLEYRLVRSQHHRFRADRHAHVAHPDALRLLPRQQQLHAQFRGLHVVATRPTGTKRSPSAATFPITSLRISPPPRLPAPAAIPSLPGPTASSITAPPASHSPIHTNWHPRAKSPRAQRATSAPTTHLTIQPTDCGNSGCHLTTWQQTNNPTHSTAGAPFAAANCSTATTPSLGLPPPSITAPPVGLSTGSTCHHRPAPVCHVNNNYTFTSANTDCFGCHQDKYNSTATLGGDVPNHVAADFPTAQCSSCHTTTNWTSTWNHNSTGFPLQNLHQIAPAGKVNACTDCHMPTTTTCKSLRRIAALPAATSPPGSKPTILRTPLQERPSHFANCSTCHNTAGGTPPLSITAPPASR